MQPFPPTSISGGVGDGVGGGFGARECFAFLEVFLDVFFFGGGGGVFDLLFFGNAEAASLSNRRLMIMVYTTAGKTEGNFLLERREKYCTVIRFGPGTAAAAAVTASVDVTFIVALLVVDVFWMIVG